MKRKNCKVGEKVYAKWPGSAKYYEAVVDEALDGEFVVSFSEGSLTATIDERNVYVSKLQIIYYLKLNLY